MTEAQFCSHLRLAHFYWKQLIREGGRVIDATCGNGNDTLVLSQCVLQESKGWVWAFDQALFVC
ncbi:MAG: hypothetical protein WB791_09565 [Waddliaceae bacterium]